ncbi:SDR family oxidoreductase [Reinekea marinisedimentorum]|uniref:Nucleoside-diphosphate-sugar epimerase n=1 Tax=Reinekea marinisedimentorum TaxID=230495 RepID=A0A4R3IFG1_9GAMM|nr:SDR family oxidoreductase [Reinekea marinisedimentorum]TCS43702.1 nucleoside-diphosphate-sugar epimerase [Reinekea marinisedimentorum]
MTTISILGSGWLGMPLAQHFLKQGFQVNLSTRTADRIPELDESGAKPFLIDIDALSSNLQSFLNASILIINITSKNIDGFKQLAAAIEASPVKHVLFVSSTSVYQNVPQVVSEADIELQSQSPLLDIEKILADVPGCSATLLRFSGLIGDGRHPGRFFRNGKVVQNPDAPVNLIHQQDCLGIIDQIIQQNCWGEVLNGCADTHPSKREFYSAAAEKLGRPAPEFSELAGQGGKIVSNEKVKKRLNYAFSYADVYDAI